MSNKFKNIILVSFVVLCVVPHALNMNHYPYFENDEGVYMSQAWSLLKFGKLAPYTYWYDHAPAGWILIAFWNFLTFGFFTFGFSINSGRVLMLLLHITASILLFFIIKRISKNDFASALGVIIFSFSPLGIYFQRRVLLDNIMIFWVLLALFLVLYCKQKLRFIIASSICFGIAILSKENAIFFTPVFLYLIFINTHPKQRLFALTKWLFIVGAITSLYFLYALIKGELFPMGTPLGGTNEHVSLLETLKQQYSRGGGGILDVEKSSFWQNMKTWINEDPLIIYAGIIATFLNLFLGVRYRANRIAGFLSASFWFFLARGGLVIEFYVIPLIPILALNIAVLVRGLNKYVVLAIMSLFIASSLYFATNMRDNQNLYTSDQTTPQIQAVEWILSNKKPSSFYMIDNYGYIDLQERGKESFKNAEWYWKVDKDSQVREDILKNSPHNIDYIALTPQMEHDISTVGLELALTAWHNSDPIARFWKDGWGVEFWATNYPHRILSSSWESYKKTFIRSGRVIDPYRDNITTSEGQSYALLRSVWMGDRQMFDELWNWTNKNMINHVGLFSWKFDGAKVEESSATDADQDIALALLFAFKVWKDPIYLENATKIINSIWENEVVALNGSYWVIAADWADSKEELVINPSYLAPYAYRIFSEVDKSHPWSQLVDSSYELLVLCTLNKLDKEEGKLPPEWCSINKSTLEIEQANTQGATASEYGYNAFRVPFRVALDYLWFGENKAKEYLKKLDFLSQEFNQKNKLLVSYEHDGAIWENYESVAAYGASIGYFLVADQGNAREVYEQKIMDKLYDEENLSYWDDPKNYYTQNWGWFGTALYSGSLTNLWDN